MFDARRFARLAVAEWTENKRAWVWFLGVLVILHFLLLLVLGFGGSLEMFRTEGQGVLFFSGLFCAGIVFAARHFRAMSDPSSALLALMRPATAFEKWLLALLVVGVAFPVAYHLVFFICDVPAALIGHALDQADAARTAVADNEPFVATRFGASEFVPFHVFQLDGRDIVGLLLYLTCLQAFAIAGSLLFHKAPFLKTLLAGFCLLLVLIAVDVPTGASPELLFTYWESEARLPAWQEWLYAATWLVVPGLLWFSIWLALREREIAR